MNGRRAIIIGAGPAGLTAAYELLDKTDIVPTIFEMDDGIGGICRTVNYEGNRIDIGGHRFFSKSDRVMEWWNKILPLQGAPALDDIILNRDVPLSTSLNAPDPSKTDLVMLVRSRLSRIYYRGKFFDYPVSLNMKTIMNLGLVRILKIIFSYIKIRLIPIRREKSLEDFFINRFGKELYNTFFKAYTEKVWGVPCSEISSDWGAQRIKELSISKALAHAIKRVFISDKSIAQKSTETSLIGRFLYPKLGPGQIWEEVGRIITDRGGSIHLGHRVIGLVKESNRIVGATVRDELNGQIRTEMGDYFFSTMPIKDLIHCLDGDVPEDVRIVANGLRYRDFISIGLLMKELKIKNETKISTMNNIIPDNWIYIQDGSVNVGRIQIFNNWSPYLVKDESSVWIGCEYFCNEGDDLWSKSDGELAELAVNELARIGIIDKDKVVKSVVMRMLKTYPAYCGSYNRFDVIKEYANTFDNLFLIGRNGMHRYNNQDHSMLTALTAVENIIHNVQSKNNIWDVNIENSYHESQA